MICDLQSVAVREAEGTVGETSVILGFAGLMPQVAAMATCVFDGTSDLAAMFAFGYGVLEELRRTKFDLNGRHAADDVGGVSGGSILAAYYAAGGSPRHAAGTLHVHVNTVSQRLERIAALLGTTKTSR